MKLKNIVLIVLLLATGCISDRAGLHPSLSYRLTGADREGDRITLSIEGESQIFDVYSKSGIGRIEISSVDGNWPKSVILRFHLAGLEALDVDNGRSAINADKLIKLVNKERRRAPPTPVDEGYYEVTLLPNEILDKPPKTIFIQWIDFLRR